MANFAELTSLGGIARWIDDSVTQTLLGTVAPMVSNFTSNILPFVSASLTISLIWYGWLIAIGTIHTSIFTALRKVVDIVIIVSIAGAGGLYQTEIVGVMLDLPAAATSLVAGSDITPAQVIDNTANSGAETATRILDRAPSVLRAIGMALTFALVSVVMALVAAAFSGLGTVILIVIKVGMALLAVVGPLAILALLFDFTKEYFKNWVGQGLFYTLYAALFTIVFGLVMGMFQILQQAILTGLTSGGDINIFGILTAIVLFVTASIYMLTQVGAIVGKLTGGAGLKVPFIG